ncbi:hypothetical protein BS50DRAFT_272250 [Corynespora cassiicola Philippines]|uniref:Camp independent regulatory protein n=1 Tax=Corynespora cassiicola Philippines TaxID=1448308 RepID=A0A2T2P0A2_CORCC|nr:hypothetical protein BS50DRAFT_272250 [Corynespora cassiicola Philippines]
MLQGIRPSTLNMPSFGHNMSLGVQKMDGYPDTDSWTWTQQAHTPPQTYPNIFDPSLYANFTAHLQPPGAVPTRHHSIATSHVIPSGTSTPPPRQQIAGSMVKAQPAFKPTWHGFLDTTKDAMTIVEAALQGRLSHISRRPHDKERAEMLTSGTVLVYEENASGIKRWTDAVHWSPSRVMNNCLIYRQLVRALKPEEKKSALNPSCGSKRKRKEGTSPSITKTGENVNTSEDEYENPTFEGALTGEVTPNEKVYANFAQSLTPDQQRRFCGSLIDSYEFKEGGLMKKTISVKYQGTTHHIISYYSLEDVVSGKLKRPFQDQKLADVQPRPELLTGWKVSLEDEESKDMPLIAGYPPHLQPGHMHHPSMSVAAGVPHGLPHSSALHLQTHDYWHGNQFHQYSSAHQSSSHYTSPQHTASPYAPPQAASQYSQQHSPQHYSAQPASTAQYSQQPSPQHYSSQPPSAPQYAAQPPAAPQYTPQAQTTPQYSAPEPQVSPAAQYPPPASAAQYTASHQEQVAPSPQYAVPQAPVFDLHVPVPPQTSTPVQQTQSPIPQHDPARRASAPVALQSYSQPQYHATPQAQSYYVNDQKYPTAPSYGF